MEANEPSALELLGSFLKRNREELSLTREELANRVECKLSDVIEVEEGRTPLSKGMALRLQEVLQMRDDSLYNLASTDTKHRIDERRRGILRDISAGNRRNIRRKSK